MATITKKFVLQAVAEFNRLPADELAAKLANVPGTNLAALRDATRMVKSQTFDPRWTASFDYVINACTTEINRRWQ